MKGKGTGATAALLVATLVGVSFLPRRSSDSTSGTEGAKGAKSARAALSKNKIAKPKLEVCEEIGNRLQRFFLSDVPMPEDCEAGTVPPQSQTAPQFKFAVAIVPNPVQTHLALVFDRTIESIQQAAQDEGYSYDDSWFPWTQTTHSYTALADEEKAEQSEVEHELWPGVLIFRRGVGKDGPYRSGLVVFVVGEQPTGGISDHQFEHALEWVRALHSGTLPDPMLILGPTFSGSLPSLARELKLNAEPGRAFTVYSGSVNSAASVDWFGKFLTELGTANHKQSTFRTFNESDSLMTDRFLCYLKYEGYEISRVAILSEDETAFGKIPGANEARCQPKAGEDEKKADAATSTPGKQQESPIYLYYPRDIATLRTAYERQSIFSAGKQNTAPSTTLREDLSESGTGEHDTVQSYAGQLTPQAQESVLFGITNMLESQNIEFVILRSSNALDQLFLSEFLRRSYPGGRIVLDGSDLLFRRGMQGASLRGVMLLSTYPLMSWTQDRIPVLTDDDGTGYKLRRQSASKAGGKAYRVFSADLVEGTYIAARELFHDRGHRDVPPIADYAAPTRSNYQADKIDAADLEPATWLSVVGHRQFWAIAILNSHTARTKIDPKDVSIIPTAESILQPEPAESLAKPQVGVLSRFKRGVRLPGEMTALVIFCLVLGWWHFYCCRKASITGSPRARAYFAPLPRVQHVTLVFLGSLLVGVLGITLLFVSGLDKGFLSIKWTIFIYSAVVLMVLSGLVGFIDNYRLPVLTSGNSDAEEAKSLAAQLRHRKAKVWILGLAWIVLLLFLSWLRRHFLTQHFLLANEFPTFWRAVHLRSGVSPLLPQVLLILGVYAWFWFNLRGLALFGDDRPILPPLNSLPKYEVPAETRTRVPGLHSVRLDVFRMFSREQAGDDIESLAIPLRLNYAWSLVGCVCVTIAVVGLVLGEAHFRTLGDRRFGNLIFICICLCIGVILADTLQALRIWSSLRQLLTLLDRLRLRRTLDSLKGISWQSVWKMSGNVLEERYRLISRQFESARNLYNNLILWNPADPTKSVDANAIKGREEAIQALQACEKQGREFAAWYVTNLKNPAVHDIAPLYRYQEALAATAGAVMTSVIYPSWQKETRSLIFQAGASPKEEGDNYTPSTEGLEDHVRAAEEFFVLPYLGFIQNILGRIRTIVIGSLLLFVAATLAVSSYPFDPLPVIGAIFLVVFVVVGAVIVFVYAEMHRDATLSHITHTSPGELGFDFYVKIFTFGLGPLIGLLTTLFPSMTDFVVSFLQPGAQAMK